MRQFVIKLNKVFDFANLGPLLEKYVRLKLPNEDLGSRDVSLCNEQLHLSTLGFIRFDEQQQQYILFNVLTVDEKFRR
jgi:hypothetical protein